MGVWKADRQTISSLHLPSKDLEGEEGGREREGERGRGNERQEGRERNTGISITQLYSVFECRLTSWRFKYPVHSFW